MVDYFLLKSDDIEERIFWKTSRKSNSITYAKRKHSSLSNNINLTPNNDNQDKINKDFTNVCS